MSRLMNLSRTAVRAAPGAKHAAALRVPTSRALHSTARQSYDWDGESDSQYKPRGGYRHAGGGYKGNSGGYKHKPRGYDDITRKRTDRPEGWRRPFFTRPGEEFLPEGKEPPPGYEMVPSGDYFISRHCRQLTAETGRNVFLYFKDGKPRGNWVPEDIVRRVREDPDALHARDKANAMRGIAKNYPNMPEEDAVRLEELYYNFFLAPTAFSARHYHAYTTRQYVLNRYTDLKFDAPLGEDREAIGRAHEKADEILAAWRGQTGVEGEQEPAKSEY